MSFNTREALQRHVNRHLEPSVPPATSSSSSPTSHLPRQNSTKTTRGACCYCTAIYCTPLCFRTFKTPLYLLPFSLCLVSLFSYRKLWFHDVAVYTILFPLLSLSLSLSLSLLDNYGCYTFTWLVLVGNKKRTLLMLVRKYYDHPQTLQP